MNHLQTQTAPELLVAPRILDYAEAPIDEAFDWDGILQNAKQQRFLDPVIPLYLVVFRSRLKAGVDTAPLIAHDYNAHAAALQSPSLIHYFADTPDALGRSLSFCLWTDPHEAKKASKDPRHVAAAKMIYLYESYSVDKYDVHHGTEDITLVLR